MKYAFFSVPVGCKESERELNSFCATHRILAVDKHFVVDSGSGFWTFCISYIGIDPVKSAPRQKVDYKEVLSESEFSVFAELRRLRKDLADKGGVPAYAVFTNEQLAAFVRDKIITKSGMESVAGVGAAKIKSYAEVFLPVLKKLFLDPDQTQSVSRDEANSNQNQ
ncbi:HRDC domain-containing protein [Maridesulfovibrio frigidus]|uniref:HRDC domain-containing protein n=1 Tax=Maridesulfovibrio frigidus TaxID=340956 RepID=UPI0004E1F226|nr:HRDC domain-containing protein [Maridesulfovibrio frigidus]